MILPLTADEYVKAGNDVSDNVDFTKIKDYFGGARKYAESSAEFEVKVNFYAQQMQTAPLGQKPTTMKGYLGSKKMADLARTAEIERLDEAGYTVQQFCFIPIYNPAGTAGSAELIVAESQDNYGGEGEPCYVGNICQDGYRCIDSTGGKICW